MEKLTENWDLVCSNPKDLLLSEGIDWRTFYEEARVAVVKPMELIMELLETYYQAAAHGEPSEKEHYAARMWASSETITMILSAAQTNFDNLWHVFHRIEDELRAKKAA